MKSKIAILVGLARLRELAVAPGTACRGAGAVVGARRTSSMQSFAEGYAYGPTRVQFENKDPRGFAEFARILAEHSACILGFRPDLHRVQPGLGSPTSF